MTEVTDTLIADLADMQRHAIANDEIAAQVDDLGASIERVIAQRDRLQKQLDIARSGLGLVANAATAMPRDNIAAIARASLEQMERVP